MHPRTERSSHVARLGAAVLCTALLWPAEASAQAPAQAPAPNHPDFAFGSPTGEVLLVLAAGLSNVSSLLPQGATAWGPDAPHPYDRTADRLSDVTGAYGGAAIGLLAGIGMEAGYFGEGGVRGGVVYAQRTALVELEGLLFTRAIVDAVKRATGRCRPHHFEAGGCTTDVRDAFPSGHTAPMGAMAGSRLVMAAQSTGASGYRWGSFALAEGMAVATAWLRVRAGKHSWSDVGAGWLLGHAVGVLVALAHPMQRVPAGEIGPVDGDGVTGQGGFGLTWTGTF